MELRVSDPSYTDRLATFLRSLGQTVIVAAPGELVVDVVPSSSSRDEIVIYLRVWSVLYPDAEVQIGVEAEGDGET